MADTMRPSAQILVPTDLGRGAGHAVERRLPGSIAESLLGPADCDRRVAGKR